VLKEVAVMENSLDKDDISEAENRSPYKENKNQVLCEYSREDLQYDCTVALEQLQN